MRYTLTITVLSLLCLFVAPVQAGEKAGIGSTTINATKDVNDFIKLAKNGSAPVACTFTNDGAIALTSAYALCVCKNGSGWVTAYDSLTACSW